MMKSRLYWLLLLVGSVMLFNLNGCKSDPPDPPVVEGKPPTLELRLQIVNGAQEVEWSEAFTDDQNNRIELRLLKLYLANIKVRNVEETMISLADIELFDLSPLEDGVPGPQWGDSYTYELPIGTYDQIEFGIGVPSDLNDEDPTTYSNDDALSTYSGMYWNWATMYRFVILEAVADTQGSGNFDQDIVFHTGLDELYREGVALPIELALEASDAKVITLQFDWNKLFYDDSNPIDIRDKPVTHATDNESDRLLAEQFTNNLVKAISIK